MIIQFGNTLVKSPISYVTDLYESTFSHIVIVEENRVTGGAFDNQMPVHIKIGRDVTFRFKLMKVDSHGNTFAYSLSEIDSVVLVLREKEGYSTVVDEKSPEVPIEWDLNIETPASLGLCYYEVDPEDDIPIKGTYKAEIQLHKNSKIFFFTQFPVIVSNL
jgi:hypothetical protein